MAQVKSIETLITLLTSLGYDNTKRISGNKVAVLTDENRIAVLRMIQKRIKGSVYDQTPRSESSVGRVTVGSYIILVKPASKQGKASAGVNNEHNLVETVSEILSRLGSVNIIFKTKTGRKYNIPQCISVAAVGADTLGRKKADIVFVSRGNSKYPVSIKKDNAEIWESADSFFGKQAKIIIDKAVADGKTKLVDKGTYYNIQPNIAVSASRTERLDVVFGSDLQNNGSVITRTFESSDFVLKEETLTINVSDIITNESHIKGDKDVFFLIRNDKTRKSIPEYPGIRILAVYKSRINKNVVVVDR